METKGMNKYKIYQLLAIFIILQPVIDFLTSFMVRYITLPLTIGVITRALFLIAMFAYIVWYVPNQKKKLSLLITGLVILYGIAFLFVNYQGLSSLLANAKGLFKIFYFPLLLVYFMELTSYDEVKLDHTYFFLASSIYIIVILLADVTGTQFYSYQYEKVGHVGWFYAANEIGAVLALLSPVSIHYVLNKKKPLLTILYVSIYAYIVLIIGTKVPYIGFMGALASLFVLYIVKKNWKFVLTIALCGVIAVGIFPFSNLASNMNIHIASLFPSDTEGTPEKPMTDQDKITNLILSSRDLYLAQNMKMFRERGLMHQMFGLGYVDQGEEIKLVEIDYADILICNGYVGGLIILMSFLYACFIIIRKLIGRHIGRVIFSPSFYVLAVSAVLGLGIAGLAGHVLTAPGVSFYLVLYASQMRAHETLEIGNE